MNVPMLFLVRLVPPAMGVLAGLLGVATLEANLLGWLLLVAGVLYAAGEIIATYILRRDAQPESAASSAAVTWPLRAAVALALFVAPLECLYLKLDARRTIELELAGVCLGLLAAGLFAWTRAGRDDSDHAGIQASGVYRVVRYPACTAYLLGALGLAIGYGSVWGFAALLLVLVPAVLLHIRWADRTRSMRMGPAYEAYAARTRRLIPGVW